MAAGSNSVVASFSDTAVHLLGVMARVAGWGPDAFWAATPADVAAVLGGWVDADAAALPPDRAMMGVLMEQFPDGG